MNNIKNTLALLLVTVIISGLFSGCGFTSPAISGFFSCGSSGALSSCDSCVSSSDNGILSKCGPEYFAECDFFYSIDYGRTYSNGIKEFTVGDTVYMKIKFIVTSDRKKASNVNVVLTVPCIDSVDANYMDGQIVTPTFDEANNVTKYEFIAIASKDPVEQECVIQFIPNKVGEISVTLTFDDNVEPNYDKQSTLVFVKKGKNK